MTKFYKKNVFRECMKPEKFNLPKLSNGLDNYGCVDKGTHRLLSVSSGSFPRSIKYEKCVRLTFALEEKKEQECTLSVCLKLMV